MRRALKAQNSPSGTTIVLSLEGTDVKRYFWKSAVLAGVHPPCGASPGKTGYKLPGQCTAASITEYMACENSL